MVFFAVYAVLIWYYALKWRRRWASVGVVLAGLAGLALIWLGHAMLNEWTHGALNVVVLRLFLAPYMGLVGIVGFYLCVLPRRPKPNHCAVCEYDLVGLEERARLICPECGLPYSAHQAEDDGAGDRAVPVAGGPLSPAAGAAPLRAAEPAGAGRRSATIEWPASHPA